MPILRNIREVFRRDSVSDSKDAAVGTVQTVLIIASFAVVAILAVTWIGGSAAGVAADTTECIRAGSTGDADYADNLCNTEGDKKKSASAANTSSAAWTERFGDEELTEEEKAAAVVTEEELAKARNDLERGILRFGGAKSTINADASTYLNILRTTNNKAEATAALNSIRALINTAALDGELPGKVATLANARDTLKKAGADAWAQAEYAQRLAQESNRLRQAALVNASYAVTKANTMSMAELRSYASLIEADLSKAQSQAQKAVPEIQRALEVAKKL